MVTVGNAEPRAHPSANSLPDVPRPPDRCALPSAHATTATTVPVPHSRGRDSLGELLTHVPLESFLQTLESSPAASGHLAGTGMQDTAPGVHRGRGGRVGRGQCLGAP